MASYTLSPVGGAAAQFFDNNGNLLSGGKLYTYAAGTTTPQTTWTTPAGGASNTNPIILDSAGRPPQEIWLSVAYSYKFVLKTSTDVPIATYDNIPGLPQPAIANDAASISYEPLPAITAGSFLVGKTYMIASLGTTDFTLIGAAVNSTGVIFTATGVGTGDGTAYNSTTVAKKLQQTVSVMDFGASASATPAVNAVAITAAINYSLSVSPHLTVLFPEVCDITGYTITITKAPDYGDRQYLKLFGTGGGIKKTDAGFIFQGYAPLVGDISVMCMSFVSNNSAGTIVWDCNTILRISSSHNEYLNVDGITKQDSVVLMQLMQSCRFTNEKITGGRGAAFLWQRASDCTFSNLLVENRETTFENVLDTGVDVNLNQNFNVRITDCVIEGNVYGDAHAIKWGNSWCCTIARNYFESNKTDIDLDTLVRASHKGLTFMGNVFFLSAAQKTAGYKPVKVGNLWTVSTTNYRSHTNFFAGNVSDGELYDFVGTGNLNSFGDYSLQFTGWNNPRINAFSGVNSSTTAGSNTLKTTGVTRQISFTRTETNVLAGEIRTVAISLSDADVPGIALESTIYTVYPRQISSISVLGISPVFATSTSGTLNVVIENRTLSTVASAVLAINILIAGD